MKKLLSVLGITGLLVGTAMASTPFTIDDSGFDYATAEDGYTSISYEDGELKLLITDVVTNEALKISGSDFLPLDADDVADLSAGVLLENLPIAEEFSGVEVAHADAELATIVATYSDLFEAQGFSSSLEQNYSHGEVMLYKNADTTARVIFTQQGLDVNVFFTLL
jgi:hypothetical protein